MIGMEDINRLKLVLVEKKENRKVAGRTVGEGSINNINMVYQCFTA